MKTIHYSPSGYNGNYTYDSICGKKVNSHQESEGSSIHPDKANCKDCLATETYKVHLEDLRAVNSDIKRRIYIESDILRSGEFKSAQRTVWNFVADKGLKCVDRVFSEVLDFAWHKLEETWLAVKNADEIYATSSLLPLGGGYMGAPVIFNGMCERAIKEGITGKSVIILSDIAYVSWGMIDISIMKKAFKKNDLIMYDNDELVKINTSKITGK